MSTREELFVSEADATNLEPFPAAARGQRNLFAQHGEIVMKNKISFRGFAWIAQP
jgi:hypothetical protein